MIVKVKEPIAFPYIAELAFRGWKDACRDNAALKKGLNIKGGNVVYQGVAEAFSISKNKVEELV